MGGHRAAWRMLAGALVAAQAAGGLAADEPAADKLQAISGAPGGICAVVGAADAELALALARRGPFTVQCLPADALRVGEIRSAIRARGLYGTVSADGLSGGGLPYADNLLNIVIVEGLPALRQQGVTAAEMLRVLAPLGSGYVSLPAGEDGDAAARALEADLRAAGAADLSRVEAGGRWLRFAKPWPNDIDEWTHYLHGADGNPVARDRVVGPPEHYQWTTGPRWMRSHESDSSVSTLVTARGRLFYIVDEAPISLVGNHPLPDKWSLAARDAFNGVLLWKVPISRWGWREWKPSWFNTRPGDIPLNIQKRLVAADEKVYVTLGYRAPVSQLDARTGQILQTYAGTEPAGEILHLDGKLLLSVFDAGRVRVMAVEAATGRRLWASRETYAGTTVDYIRWREMGGGTPPAKLDPAANLAADGTSVALLDGGDIVCLDARDGAERWRAAFPLDKADLNAGGIQTNGHLWVGTLIVADGVVLHASPSKLAAFSARDGKLLWTQPKAYIGHLWYEWKDVFVIGGLAWTWDANLVRGELAGAAKGRQRTVYPDRASGYDLHSGQVRRQVDLGVIFKTMHHHRCYRNKATVRYILASRRGSEFVDLEGGQHTVHNWVRGTCHVGMMPANGLQYTPPHPCVCYIEEKLNGFSALAPRRGEQPPAAPVEDAGRILRGGAFGSPIGPEAAADDWPTFRHDALRSGSTPAVVADDARQAWRVSVGRSVSAPVAAAGRVLVSLVDQHHVACLDAATGRTLWQFAAGSRVDSPPTCWRGRVLFGSADGRVYCLRAGDGELVWRYDAARRRRLIAVDGQLESAWPVSGSVPVRDGTVYFAAGRTSELDGGIDLFGLDAATGKVLHHVALAGPDYAAGPDGTLVVRREKTSEAMMPAGDFRQNFQLPMGVLADVLAADANSIYMGTKAFDAALKPRPGRPAMTPKAGYLDDNYFKRTPWTEGSDYARLIVRDSRFVCFVQMFDTLRGLDPTVYFTPGAKGYLLFARNPGGKSRLWSYRVPIRVRAMVLAGGRLFVAGPPDTVDADDPLGAFEGRKAGLLHVIDSSTGERLAEHKLPAPPVFNGAAVAAGRLFIAEQDGTVTCFARP